MFSDRLRPKSPFRHRHHHLASSSPRPLKEGGRTPSPLATRHSSSLPVSSPPTAGAAGTTMSPLLSPTGAMRMEMLRAEIDGDIVEVYKQKLEQQLAVVQQMEQQLEGMAQYRTEYEAMQLSYEEAAAARDRNEELIAHLQAELTDITDLVRNEVAALKVGKQRLEQEAAHLEVERNEALTERDQLRGTVRLQEEEIGKLRAAVVELASIRHVGGVQS